MNNPVHKIRYLGITIPALWLAACSGGGSCNSCSTPVPPPAPYITFLTTNLNNSTTSPGESFVITGVLTSNGNNIPNQTLVPYSLFPASESIIYSPPSCIVSSMPGKESCSITVLIESRVIAESYALTMSNVTTPSMTLFDNSISFYIHCNPCGLLFVPWVNGNIGGVAGADAICAESASNLGLGNNYKAFITGPNRWACTSPNCAESGIKENYNWVLYPNTTYSWYNGNTFFITNESAIYPFGKFYSRSPYPWFGLVRTGFNHSNDWTSPQVSSPINCNGWTSAGLAYGHMGNLYSSKQNNQVTNSIDAAQILGQNTTQACSRTNNKNNHAFPIGLFCIPQ